jgi:hypothetical protein
MHVKYIYISHYPTSKTAHAYSKEEYWKHKNVALKKDFFCFVLLSGKLGPIFTVPCSNNFHFKNYYLFCTRTRIQSWSIGDNFMLPDLSHPGFFFFFFSSRFALLFFCQHFSSLFLSLSLLLSPFSLCQCGEREGADPPSPPPHPPRA